VEEQALLAIQGNTPMGLTPRYLLRAESFPPLTLSLLPCGRRSFGAEAMAARAADVPVFAVVFPEIYSIWQTKARHIRRFGNISVLEPGVVDLVHR
jgi:hypothetical protein